jgi:Family of unknown function (DUF5330)
VINKGAGMRIFRTIMLLTGVATFMPSPPEEQARVGAEQTSVEMSTPSLLGSAATAVADVAAICNRQPGVCKAAGYVAGKLEAKAKYSVRLIYEWANESSGEPKTSPLTDQAGADPIETGSTVVAAVGGGSQSTLRIEDLMPVWRGANAHKKS